MATDKRYRLQYKFWLNQYDEEEKLVSEIIEWLKTERDFTKAIRDGLRLIWDLRNGRVEVLLELFPQIREWLSTPEPPPNDPTGNLEKRLIRIEDLILTQKELPEPPANYPQLKPLSTKLQPIFELPRLDDDEETLILKKSTNVDASANFYAAMMNLQ